MKAVLTKSRTHDVIGNDGPIILETIVHWISLVGAQKRASAKHPSKERSGQHDRESRGFFVIAFRFTLPKKKVPHCGWSRDSRQVASGNPQTAPARLENWRSTCLGISSSSLKNRPHRSSHSKRTAAILTFRRARNARFEARIFSLK